MLRTVLITSLLLSGSVGSLYAKTLSGAEVRKAMLGKTIKTRRFGLSVTMRYRTNGTVSASSLIGSVNGTWRGKGNRICTTFPSGPAKGTSCVTFERLGPNKFRSSEGVTFTAH